jgi:putative flavoprotein involved in K+ transport
MPDNVYDVLVIGGGQAGLAAGYHLKRARLRFRILEAAPRVGDSWRRRYRSLTLFTPRAFSELPGLPLPGDPAGYPSRDEFAGYLESYASAHGLPVYLNAEVVRLTRDDLGFRLRVRDGSEHTAKAVIVAAGAFRKPLQPMVSKGFDASVVQLDAETYSGPEDVPPGKVLVVGDGATGRDIAAELAVTHEVILATGKTRKLFPERILGKSVWWWMTKLGLMRLGPRSFVGRLMRRSDPFPDRGRSIEALRSRGLQIAGRLISSKDRTAEFDDGSRVEVGAAVWSVGYHDELDWIEIPGVTDSRGAPVHDGGVSPIRGLFFLGRPWQRNRASALVMGVGDDAEIVVNQVRQTMAT